MGAANKIGTSRGAQEDNCFTEADRLRKSRSGKNKRTHSKTENGTRWL